MCMGRSADKKAAINYTYEDSAPAKVVEGDKDEDDESSSDEEIDLGKSAAAVCL